MSGTVGPRRRLRTVFICQALDRDDPVVPTPARWVEVLAGKPSIEHVSVLALRTGRYDLPDNVDVKQFGRSTKLATVASFYRALATSLRHRPDFFFVCQGGPYPALLLPFKLLKGIPIVQWKAHSVITRAMAFYARRCDDLIFTPTRASFRMDLPKVRVVGHGIDTELFRIERRPALGDLIATGRISPVKRVEEMVRAVAHSNRAFGTGYRLNVYGPTLPNDEPYASRVRALIDELGAREWVKLHGAVTQEELPDLLNGHRASLNLSTGAVDKSVLEAMACGLPAISTNEAVAEVIPPDLHPTLVPDAQSTELQAGAIHGLLQRPEAEIAALGQRLRALVEAEHGVHLLFDRILEEVGALLWDRA